MDRNRVLELAREARFVEPTHPFNPWSVSGDDLERFAALVEREVRGGSMRLFCSCCAKVQPVSVVEERDSKTEESFQDMVCSVCKLVIATGTGIKAEVRGDAEPVAFEFQHEDTGMIDFVDPQQVEWGFQKNNPRWQLIGPVFRHPSPAVVAQLVEAAKRAMNYAENVVMAEGVYFDHDGDLPFIESALAAAKETGI